MGSAPDAAIFLEDLAQSFERWLRSWRASLPAVRTRWMDCAHPVGTPLAVHEMDGRSTAGLFEGLDEDGSLRLRLADGSIHAIHAGDVFLI
jgi:BirA family biotin operon repressor/biotin-[acetyl-CoA-carboxylase] ligase